MPHRRLRSRVRRKVVEKLRGLHRFCHLCGEPIGDNVTDPTHPMFITLDHLIPLSKGGSNKIENLHLAHRKCNLDKGDDNQLGEAIERLNQPKKRE